jgi:hypothetical protein
MANSHDGLLAPLGRLIEATPRWVWLVLCIAVCVVNAVL